MGKGGYNGGSTLWPRGRNRSKEVWETGSGCRPDPLYGFCLCCNRTQSEIDSGVDKASVVEELERRYPLEVTRMDFTAALSTIINSGKRRSPGEPE